MAKEMTRSGMTAWICGTVLLTGIIVAYSLKEEPYDRYAECKNWLGQVDTKCAADIASARIRGDTVDLLADPE